MADAAADLDVLKSHHEITFVRPDGYIAYSADVQDGIAAVDSVRSVLERQTSSTVPAT